MKIAGAADSAQAQLGLTRERLIKGPPRCLTELAGCDPHAAPSASVPESELTARLSTWTATGAISTLDPILSKFADRALYGPLCAFLARRGKGQRARLSALAFRLAGGEGEVPTTLPLIVECLHAGSLIIDDIEDASALRRGQPCLHHQVGMPVALNAGNALYFLPNLLLAESGLAPLEQLRVTHLVGQCLLRCHEGQALDLTVRLSELSPGEVQVVARGVSERKTGALFGLAAALGAVCAGAADAVVADLQRFGVEFGVGLQMLDDVSGVQNPARADKGMEDLRDDRVTWVWALLERELSAEAYKRWLQSALSAQDEAQWAALLDRLRFPLSVRGPERIRAHFDAACEQLARALDLSGVHQELKAELSELERRFMGG